MKYEIYATQTIRHREVVEASSAREAAQIISNIIPGWNLHEVSTVQDDPDQEAESLEIIGNCECGDILLEGDEVFHGEDCTLCKKCFEQCKP